MWQVNDMYMYQTIKGRSSVGTDRTTKLMQED